MMLQYQAIKDQYPKTVVFFRLGDFYEMFNEDALEVSRLLNLTLTKRCGNPMCGVPYHASKIYIARLLRLGKCIAVCEQVSLPSGKGLADRKVVEIITPGTTLEDAYLDQGVNNFLACVTIQKKTAAFAYIDISTGEFCATHWQYASESILTEYIRKELSRLAVRELIIPQSLSQAAFFSNILAEYPAILCAVYPDWHFAVEQCRKRLLNQFSVIHLKGFGLNDDSPEISAAGFLLEYVSKNTNSNEKLPHISTIRIYSDAQYLILDESSRKNLEITANLRDGSASYTLLEVLNHTCTSMGSRLLRQWLHFPLTDSRLIFERQEKVAQLYEAEHFLSAMRSGLSHILDIERLVSRIAMDRAHAKDIQALRCSLDSCLSIQEITGKTAYSLCFQKESLHEIVTLIEKSLLDEPSIILTEGNMIKPLWCAELDRLHSLQTNFNSILESYIAEEKQNTGIQNLKVRYNRNDGYYLEVTKGNLNAVPPHFIRRRSLVNGERFSTQRLEELEQELLTAQERIIEKEKELFIDIRNRLKNYIAILHETAVSIAEFDVLQCFAFAALKYHFTRPLVDNSSVLNITEGFHPVVSAHLPTGEFVPNSLQLGMPLNCDACAINADSADTTFALITGPNMAGKSTYLRQNALIVLLAQCGSFVSAKEAHIGVVDRIFCRVGATDNVARGESTFLVEMTETAHILRSATPASFIIMDEVGRGTSTEDGLSIAWAVSEYLLNDIGAKTLFATHYHELSRLQHPSLCCLCLEVLEQEGAVTFLKRVKKGASNNSYGIHVALLAGIPLSVVERARQILGKTAESSRSDEMQIQTAVCEEKNETIKKESENLQLFSNEELLLQDLQSINPNNITPLQALQKIESWKNLLKSM